MQVANESWVRHQRWRLMAATIMNSLAKNINMRGVNFKTEEIVSLKCTLFKWPLIIIILPASALFK